MRDRKAFVTLEVSWCSSGLESEESSIVSRLQKTYPDQLNIDLFPDSKGRHSSELQLYIGSTYIKRVVAKGKDSKSEDCILVWFLSCQEPF